MAEDIPWPNFLYGTNHQEFTESLFKIKQAKDEAFHQRLRGLQEYYHQRQTSPINYQRILVIFSIQDPVQCYYGRMIQTYLQGLGFDCREYTESLTYRSFTQYNDAKFMDEFRPDLIIHLFGLQEEFEVWKVLKVPFISWLMADKQLAAELAATCSNQQILITGNGNVYSHLLKKNYRKEQIQSVVLPVFSPSSVTTTSEDLAEQSIAIFTHLESLDAVIHDLGTVICGFLIQKIHSPQMTNIMAALKGIYFQVYACLNQVDLISLNLSDYQKILTENLQRYQLELSGEEQTMVAGYIKTEFEKFIAQRLQVKWIVDGFSDDGVVIYGPGWEQDPIYANIYRGELNSMTNPHDYRNLVLSNKINLWLGNRLKNSSYMQPGLIEGIVAGGFFMVGKLLDKEKEEAALSPFQGLLESFSSKSELFEKINYFLRHPDQRVKRADELQKYVVDHFYIGKIVENLWRLP